MGFFDEVRNAVVGVINFVTNDIPTAIGILINTVAQVGMTLEEFVETVQDSFINAITRAVLPADVARTVTLLEFLLRTPQNYGLQFLNNLGTALRTKELGDIFDVVTPAVTMAMEKARNDARGSSKQFPQEILDLITDSRDRNRLDGVHWTTIDKIDDKSFLYTWSYFTNKIKAITLFDVVVYFENPAFSSTEGQFTAIHELKHVMQFREMGEQNFMQDYLAEIVKGHGPAVALEREADFYACSLVNGGTPSYIDACPK